LSFLQNPQTRTMSTRNNSQGIHRNRPRNARDRIWDPYTSPPHRRRCAWRFGSLRTATDVATASGDISGTMKSEPPMRTSAPRRSAPASRHILRSAPAPPSSGSSGSHVWVLTAHSHAKPPGAGPFPCEPNRRYLAVWGSARDCPRVSDHVAGRPCRFPRMSDRMAGRPRGVPRMSGWR